MLDGGDLHGPEMKCNWSKRTNVFVSTVSSTALEEAMVMFSTGEGFTCCCRAQYLALEKAVAKRRHRIAMTATYSSYVASQYPKRC